MEKEEEEEDAPKKEERRRVGGGWPRARRPRSLATLRGRSATREPDRRGSTREPRVTPSRATARSLPARSEVTARNRGLLSSASVARARARAHVRWPPFSARDYYHY